MTAITMILYILLLGLVLFCVYLFALKIENSKNKGTNDHTYEEPTVKTEDLKIGYTMKEIQDFLNWQFQLGLIDSLEYNEMLMKCSPFSKGGN